MQVSNSILAIIVEVYVALIIGVIIFFLHSRKLKYLVRRQQKKILDLLQNPPAAPPPAAAPPPPPPPPAAPSLTYKNYLLKEIDETAAQFVTLSPNDDISAEQALDSPLFQRILALRYAFLRSEELGTTSPMGSEDYWDIFQQALEPLLPHPQAPAQQPQEVDNSYTTELENELEVYKKRVTNLEKFKRLFFDMEKQWGDAQSNADSYYAQLKAMSDEVIDKEGFTNLLDRYHGVYDDIHRTVVNSTTNPDGLENKSTINITRHDPRAADEIVKLRNVAADQHRIINQLQRQLRDAQSAEEKEFVIQELQQQLQRQTRFVQEAETCVQLLEEELSKALEDIASRDKSLNEKMSQGEENARIKNALHNFTLESKDLVADINRLEKENATLKQALAQGGKGASSATPVPAPVSAQKPNEDVKKIQTELNDLKKQYAELEERYLDLKLGS